MDGDHHDRAFDRDRWADSVAGRTLHVTAPTADPGDATAAGASRPEPTECRLCEETVVPVSSSPGLEPHCPLCGFVPGELAPIEDRLAELY